MQTETNNYETSKQSIFKMSACLTIFLGFVFFVLKVTVCLAGSLLGGIEGSSGTSSWSSLGKSCLVISDTFSS